MGEYILGTSEHERARLELQQSLWGPVTERFLDRLHVREGSRVLDAGCGPGAMLPSLRARAGTSGRVVAMDASAEYLALVARLCAEHGWRNVHIVQAELHTSALEPASFDLIFARWVLSFVPRPEQLIERWSRALRPGGWLAVQDYNHEGISLFPESEGFRAVVRALRRRYTDAGGDPWIAGRLAGMARAAGLEPLETHGTVLCGPPASAVFRWADAFFPFHAPALVASGALGADDEQLFQREWQQRRSDPHAQFFSPIVVDFAARKPR
jgi:ubiquinone/menaquinone biosynthesis C-methylase UbiE